MSPSANLLAVELDVAGGGAAEVRERREHPQRLLHRARDERRIVDDLAHLVGVLEQRAHATAVGRLRAVVAGGHQQEEAHDDLVLLERLAVDLGVDEDAGEVVRRVRPPLLDQHPAALEDLGDVLLHDQLRVFRPLALAGTKGVVHQPRPDDVVLGRDPHEAADHAGHDGLGDLLDQVALLAAIEAVEDARE